MMIRRFLERALGSLARAILLKYRPKIVAITGSVGKTTTKSAIVAVLSSRFRVGSSEKNYNNELGVPLTILQCDAPGRSPFAWFGLFVRAFAKLVGNDALFPQVMVIEMGADHPGDISYLLSLAPADIGVLTAISAAHTEFFGSIEGVRAEKKLVVTSLGPDGIAVMNADDKMIASLIPEIQARAVTFGFGEGAQARATQLSVHYDAHGLPDGTAAEISLDGERAPVVIPGVIGRPAIYAVLAAVQVGRALGLSIAEMQNGLMNFVSPAGRLRVIRGIKETVLLDDTYNSSPKAAAEAIDALASLTARHHRIAVLGDMLELGRLTEVAHSHIGELVAKHGIDVLITVGPASHKTADAARAAGMSEDRVFSFDTSGAAGKFLQDRLESGDVVLIKGSQGVRMEYVVKEVMAEPLRAAELLVRQSNKWI